MLTVPERKNRPHARDIPPRGGSQHPFWSCWGALGDPGLTSQSLGVILGFSWGDFGLVLSSSWGSPSALGGFPHVLGGLLRLLLGLLTVILTSRSDRLSVLGGLSLSYALTFFLSYSLTHIL